MHVIRVELPKQQNEIEVHVIADVHLSDPNCDIRGVQKRVADIAERDNAYVILAGDLIDNATRSSIGDIYSTQLSPMEQIQLANKTFAPLKGRILCAVPGNHEERTYRADGIDITWLIANELGAGNRYAPDAALVFVSLGENSRRKSEGRQTTSPSTSTTATAVGARLAARSTGLRTMRRLLTQTFMFAGTRTPLPCLRTASSGQTLLRGARSRLNDCLLTLRLRWTTAAATVCGWAINRRARPRLSFTLTGGGKMPGLQCEGALCRKMKISSGRFWTLSAAGILPR